MNEFKLKLKAKTFFLVRTESRIPVRRIDKDALYETFYFGFDQHPS